MDKAKNPFSPGAGNSPPELAGRSLILEDARVTLERVKNGRAEQSMMLVGLRGVGKTVLLTEIRHLAENTGYRVAFIELLESKRNKPLAQQLLPPLRRILFDLDRGEMMSEKAKKALRVFKSFMSTIRLKSGDLELYVSVDPETGQADSGDLEVDLTDLFVAIGEAAKERKTAVAIIIDEMQYLQEVELSALIMAAHRVSQRALPLILVGAGLPQLRGKAGNSKSYAERLFSFKEVDRLKKEDADLALQEPVKELAVAFTSDALDEIYRVTRGYPYFIQEWGKQAWNLASHSPITEDDIKKATPFAIDSLDSSFFRVRLERLTPMEKKYVRALAELGTTAQRSGEIAKLLGKPVEKVSPLRSQIISKGMIYSPAHGDTAFTVPLFEEFLMREIPTFSAKDEY